MATIIDILIDMDLISEEDVEEADLYCSKNGGEPHEALLSLNYVTEEDILFAIGSQTGMDVIDLDNEEILPEVVDQVPKNIAFGHRVMPVAEEDGVVIIALSDPMNAAVLDDLSFMLNKEIRGAISSPESIDAAIERYYGAEDDQTMDDALQELGIDVDSMAVVEDGGGQDLENIESASQSAPVVKLLNLILLQAIKDKAADIHLEPFEKEFKVRQRIDGVLYEIMKPPIHLAPALVSRVKVMAGLDISERRLPQDGRIELKVGGRPVDIRVSTLPTVFGESTVMRILDRSNVSLDLNNLGIRSGDLKVIKQVIAKPNGIVLVTGPTGSGKTTTLYSALQEINNIDVKIITTEDPVEYDLNGLIQCNVNPEVGLTYASCLRAILRQDPDVVFVGEIRDKTTAGIAVEAALTGHLVLSTLHTNDAPSVATRLVDIGIEPFLVGAVLEAVIAQRLIRRICGECKVEYDPSQEELFELQLTRDKVSNRKFYYGEGCKVCNNTGYKGRVAIFEMMLGTSKVKEAILNNVPLSDLQRTARKEGMRTLRESGLIAIFEGTTTIEEIVKETVFGG